MNSCVIGEKLAERGVVFILADLKIINSIRIFLLEVNNYNTLFFDRIYALQINTEILKVLINDLGPQQTSLLDYPNLVDPIGRSVSAVRISRHPFQHIAHRVALSTKSKDCAAFRHPRQWSITFLLKNNFR